MLLRKIFTEKKSNERDYGADNSVQWFVAVISIVALFMILNSLRII